MGQFGNNVKSAIKLVLFKCIKGYTVTECKDLFFTQVAQAHYRNADVTLACERCYKRLFTKACMGCKRFSLKERKNVMFLNKIDLPYCLVCILCCLSASQAVLKRFRRELLAVEQQQRIEQGNKVSRFYLKTYHFFSLLRKTFVNIRL